MTMDRFDNPKYVNWFKDAISLHLAKEGLENLTDQGVKEIHENIKSSIGYTGGQCYSCEKIELKKQWRSGKFICGSNICDQWLKEIKNLCYNTNSVDWGNVDLPCLPVSPWECVKLFLPQGSQYIHCAKDADIAAMMTLFLNSQSFSNQMRNVNICQEVKDLRNRVVHSGSCELSSEEFNKDIEKIIQMLEDPKTLKLNANCQEVVRKIKQLRDGQLELSLYKELELKILNEKIKIIKDFTRKLWKDCENIGKQVENLNSKNRENITTIASLQEENKTIKTELHNKSAEIDKYKSRAHLFLEFLRSIGQDECDLDQLSESEDKLKALGSRISGYQERLTDHENRICHLEKQHHHLKQRVDAHLDYCTSRKRHNYDYRTPVIIQSKMPKRSINQADLELHPIPPSPDQEVPTPPSIDQDVPPPLPWQDQVVPAPPPPPTATVLPEAVFPVDSMPELERTNMKPIMAVPVYYNQPGPEVSPDQEVPDILSSPASPSPPTITIIPLEGEREIVKSYALFPSALPDTTQLIQGISTRVPPRFPPKRVMVHERVSLDPRLLVKNSPSSFSSRAFAAQRNELVFLANPDNVKVEYGCYEGSLVKKTVGLDNGRMVTMYSPVLLHDSFKISISTQTQTE